MKCPKCGSTNVTPSHKRGLERVLQYVYPKVPYRCKECWSRYWMLQSPFANRKSLIGTITVMVLVVLFLVLPFLPSHENGVSSTGPALPESTELTPLPELTEPEKPDMAPLEPAAVPEEPEKSGAVATVDIPAAPAVDPTDVLAADPVVEATAEDSEAPAEDAADVADASVETAAATPDTAAETGEKPASEETPAATAEAAPAGSSEPVQAAARGGRREFSRVTSIRQIEEGDGFRMALESSGPIEDFAAFTMKNPPRLVINLSGTWEIRGQRTFPMQDDLVRRVRIGEHPRFLSVVLDLKRAAPADPRIDKTDKGITLTLENG